VTEVGFYHLTRSPLEEALPRLLEKVLLAGHRAVLRAVDEERLEHLNRCLWTYTNDSFLPHGSRADGFAEDQPVFLTTEVENPNGASVLVLVDAAAADDLARYARVLELFDGEDPGQVAAARERWRSLVAAGHACTYWQQNERGGWSKGAEAGASAAADASL
jgi:DNA polymerase III subunit chi